jgi:hypothetical protein
VISNNKPLSNINQLLQLGLINDLKKLPYGRIILQDPNQGVKSMVYRDLAVEIFNKLVDYCLNDAVMYNRLRQLLQQDHHMSKESFDNLAAKAEKSNIDLLTVIEVYNEGYNQDYPNHLTREQRAFNRVNAFLATEELTDSNERQADVVTTPVKRTFKTIKKALKK